MIDCSNRRQFLQLAGSGAVACAATGGIATVPAAEAPLPFQLGMASYTFREFSLEQALEMTKRLGLKRIALKDFHLNTFL